MSLNDRRPLLLLSQLTYLDQNSTNYSQGSAGFFFFFDKALIGHSHTQSFFLKVFGLFLPSELVLLGNCNRALMTLKGPKYSLFLHKIFC